MNPVVCFALKLFEVRNQLTIKPAARIFVLKEMTCRAIFLVLLVTLLSIVSIHADLELVSDEDLEKLIANEKNVIALFRTGMFF